MYLNSVSYPKIKLALSTSNYAWKIVELIHRLIYFHIYKLNFNVIITISNNKSKYQTAKNPQLFRFLGFTERQEGSSFHSSMPREFIVLPSISNIFKLNKFRFKVNRWSHEVSLKIKSQRNIFVYTSFYFRFYVLILN